MININSEMLVSSLFVLGFDSVDSMLFTYTLGKLSLDNQKLKLLTLKMIQLQVHLINMLSMME